MAIAAQHSLAEGSTFCLGNAGHLLENSTLRACAQWFVRRVLAIRSGNVLQEWCLFFALTAGSLPLKIKPPAYAQSWP